jgi:cell wall integrity and stress response component
VTQQGSETSIASLTWTPTPVTSVETVTGQVRTVTITPTSPPASQSNLSSVQQGNGGGSGLSTGQAVGLTVGLVILVGIIAAAIFFYLRWVRQREAGFDIATPIGSSSGPLQPRRMSETSRYMLGTDGRQVVEGWQDDDIAGSRRSRLMPVDPRLNPFAPVYQRGDGSKSRESVATIQDHHDYSRRVVNQQGPILRATNPD